MSGVIYSQQLSNAFWGTGSSQLVYTVPTATVVVVTNIDMFVISSAAGQDTFLKLKEAIPIWRESPAADTVTLQWQGRQVLLDGDTILLTTPGPRVRLGITGYVLGP